MIPDIVDLALFYLLDLLDDLDVELAIREPSSGDYVPLVNGWASDMAGAYLGDGGGRTMYSTRPVNPWIDTGGA